MIREFKPIDLPPLPEQPLFSVLIRNYNYEHYVGEALESVLAQTYTNFEAVVCDDGSTDNSCEVIQRYAERDPRIKLVTQGNGGAVRAANTAFENSKGELIALLDADDLFKPLKLETAVAAFRANPRCGLYAHRIQKVSATGQRLGPPFPGNLEQGWLGPAKLRGGGNTPFPPTVGLSFRREVASLLFPVPLEVKRLEDHYLTSTALFLTEAYLAAHCLATYRIHGASRSLASEDGEVAHSLALDARAHASIAERWEAVVPLQKDFLRRFYGPEIADTLRLEDHQGYWHMLLATRALCGRHAGAIRPYTDKEMLSHVTRPANRRLWRMILLLPDPLARRAFSFWWEPSTLKGIVKAVVLPLIRGHAR